MSKTTTTTTNNNKALLELARLSKQVETIISNDTLPLLTESIDGLGSGGVFSGAQRGPGAFFDLYGGDAADSGMGGFGGEGGLPMVQTSQFLVDRGIKPRDLIESTETAVEAVQRTATICSAAAETIITTTPAATATETATTTETETTATTRPAKASGLWGEVEQRVRGRILGLDEYVAAQRAAIQDYTITNSLEAVDKQCAVRCQELADKSWQEMLTKFSGASQVTSSSAVSAYLSNLSAAMTPIFSPGGGSNAGTTRKRKYDAAFEAQARGYATTVLAAYTQKKTYLEALAEEKEEEEKSGAQASLEGTQGLWKILLRMFYPVGQRGGVGNGSGNGNGTVNNTMLYRNTLMFLGQYFEQTRGKRGHLGYGDSGSMWERAYVSMLCNNYKRASEDITTDSIAPALGEIDQGRQLS